VLRRAPQQVVRRRQGRLQQVAPRQVGRVIQGAAWSGLALACDDAGWVRTCCGFSCTCTSCRQQAELSLQQRSACGGACSTSDLHFPSFSIGLTNHIQSATSSYSLLTQVQVDHDNLVHGYPFKRRQQLSGQSDEKRHGGGQIVREGARQEREVDVLPPGEGAWCVQQQVVAERQPVARAGLTLS